MGRSTRRDSAVMAPQPGQKRLMIIKMTLENFKSYAGVKEIGPFHKCFSSVVGPNGSGKSNVIDAMLFVFGKRAKKLRLNKVSELIHKSEAFPNLEHATVSVYFQEIIDLDDERDDDAYDVVPGSGFVVTRTAYQNNQSKYVLNGKTSTFSEVTELLRERGIDLDNNRFLILQGEVEQIAMMKPKAASPHEEGLLEYLEDIIGSNKYVPQIEELGKEVDSMNEARAEQLNRVKLAEKEVEGLEGAKAEAEALLAKERELRQQRSVLYQLFVSEAQANMDGATQKHTELSAKLDYEKNKLEQTEKELGEFEGTYKGTKAEYEALCEELAKAKDNYAAFERQDIKLNEDEKHYKAQLKKAKASVEREAKKGQEAQDLAHKKEAALPQLQEKVHAAEAAKASEAAAVEAMLEDLKGKTEDLRADLEAKQSALAPKKDALVALQTQLSTIDTEMELVSGPAQAAKAQLSKAQHTLQELSRSSSAKASELSKGEARLAELETLKEQTARALAQAEEQEKVLNARMRSAIAAAEEAKASLSQSSNMSETVKRLLAASRPGQPLANATVYGRLGDLGGIDDQYDVAVSTAGGSQLDFVVVETTQGAQQCIEYLRQNNLGRTSVIVLEQLGWVKPHIEAPFRGPAGVPRLFDLVRPSHPRFRPAFYMALKNTLVARDLDSAVAIAYEGNRCKWRVVTQDGQLIDTSGAMSGGGSQVRRGAMGTSARSGGAAAGGGGGAAVPAGGATQKEVERLEAESRAVRKELDDCRAAKKRHTDEARALEKEATKLQTSLPMLRMEIDSFAEQAKELQATVDVLRSECEVGGEGQRRLEELGKQKDDLNKHVREAQTEVTRMEAQVKALQAAIVDVGGPKLKQQQKKLDNATAALDEAVDAVNAAQVEANTAKKNFDKAQKAEEKAASEVADLTARLEAIATDRKQLQHDAEEVNKAYEAANATTAAKKSELDKLMATYNELKKKVSTIKQVEVDIQDQLEEYERVRKDNGEKQKHWAAEIAKIRKAHADDLAELEAAEGPDSNEGEDEEDDTEAAEKRRAVRESRELKEYTPEELQAVDKEQLKYKLNLIEQERDRLRENVNMGALAAYRAKESEYKARLKDLDKATEARNEVRRRHDDVRRQRLEDFMSGFAHITLKLKEMYQMITLGGDAELELVDSLDPFSEGIIFSVRPPKKSWKNISNLSGGEKTLSSLALVFALHHYKPTPLYVMDEIDAALDFKNVSIVASYIKERTKNAQFVIISLRNNMFELADRLVGIYKVSNATNSVTINPHKLSSFLPSSAESDDPAAPFRDATNRPVAQAGGGRG